MSYTLDELTNPLTADEVETAIYSAVEGQGAKTTAWKPGAVVRTLIAGVSLVLAAFSSLIALIAGAGFLDLSSGDWLTLLAEYVFGVERIDATFASGTVTLTNASATPYSGGADDLIVQNSTTGATYRSTEAWSLAAYGTTDVAVRAVEAGSDGTSPAGDIDTLVTTMSGVTVENAAALVGSDEEEDDALKTRCRERTGALSPNGPKDAYGYAARNAVDSDGVSIGITRVTTQAVGDGSVNVWVATDSGGVTGDVEDEETDLGAVAAAIYEQAEPLGIEAVVDTASELNVPVVYGLWIYTSAGLTDTEVKALVSSALAELFSDTPIGGHLIGSNRYLHMDRIAATIEGVRPDVFHVDLAAPVSDVSMTINQVAVLGTVTGVVTLVSGGDL